MVELSMVLDILQTVSIIIGVFYYIMTLQNSNRTQQLTLKAQEQAVETRQGQLFMQIVSHTNSGTFMEDYFTVIETDDPVIINDGTFRPYNKETAASVMRVGTFLEGIGSLVYRGLINPVFVSDLLNSVTKLYWEKRKPWILQQRKAGENPRYGEYIEYLANELQKYAGQVRPELKS